MTKFIKRLESTKNTNTVCPEIILLYKYISNTVENNENSNLSGRIDFPVYQIKEYKLY